MTVRTVRDTWIVIGLFVLAFALRLALLDQYTTSPYFLPIGWDPKAYDLWAQEIAAGHVFPGEAFHQPPLYPFLLGALYTLIGRDFYLIYLLQAAAGSLTVALLFVLGRACFDRLTGLLAALLWCFHGLAAMYTVKLLSETLTVLLVVLLALALYRATARTITNPVSIAREGRPPGRPVAAPPPIPGSTHTNTSSDALLRWLGCGLLLGLCVALKPNLILLLPAVWLHLWLNGRDSAAACIRACAAVTLGATVVLTPILVQNYAAEGDFIFVSWNGGGNLYSGNNPDAIGLPEPLPGVSQDRLWRPIDERDVVGRALGIAHPSAGTISAYWSRQATTFMRDQPGRFALLLVQKFRLAISGMENAHMYYLAHERERFTPRYRLFPVNFYLLFPLAVVGLIATVAQWRRHALLYALIAASFASLLIFYVLTRFRLPAEPFLVLFAAHALARLHPRAPDFPRLLGLLAVFALATTLMFLQDRNRFPGRAPYIEFNLAEHFFENGRLAEAEKTYWRAATMNPQNLYPALGICKILLARHQPDRALAAYRAILPYTDAEFRRDALRDEALSPLHPAMASFAVAGGADPSPASSRPATENTSPPSEPSRNYPH